MDITCPQCDFSKTLDPSKVPDHPIKATCPKCGHQFTYVKSVDQHTTETGLPEQVTCPQCGLAQAKGEPCRGCGYQRVDDSSRRTGVSYESTTTDSSLHGFARLRSVANDLPAELKPKAGFWLRVVATLIDSVLLSAIQLALTLSISFVVGLLGIATSEDPAISFIVWLFGMTISFGYAVFFTGYCGQTPGKMALRIKVIRTDGDPVSYGRAAKREILGKFVSSILLCIGYIMVAFDTHKQGLHDKIADTYVIKM